MLRRQRCAHGTRTEWTWDDAQRSTEIIHTKAGATLLKLVYTYTPDGLVSSLAQTTGTGTLTTNYLYDKRNRLIRETGTAPFSGVPFDVGYTCDQVGNRLTKTDYQADPDIVWVYKYDVQFPGPPGGEPVHKTWNNRLLWIEKRSGGAGETLLETTYFAYNRGGQAKRIVIKAEGSSVWYERYLEYTLDQNMWLVQKYAYNASGRTPINAWRWTDQEGSAGVPPADRSYGDFTAPWAGRIAESPWRPPTVNEVTRYLDGMGAQAVQTVSSGATKYLHADLTRSTNATSDGGGAGFQPVTFAYTAFGEHVDSGGVGVPPANPPTRYLYDGGWGYESGMLAVPGAGPSFSGANSNLAPLTLQHVGARWYQPGIGRFIQRDPLGLLGDINVYAYCRAIVPVRIDPTGLIDDMGSTCGSPFCNCPEHCARGDGPGFPVGTLAGSLLNIRVPKGIVFPGQSPTKNLVSSVLIRTLGKDYGFRAIAPWLPGIGLVCDAKIVANIVHDQGFPMPPDLPPPGIGKRIMEKLNPIR